VAGLVGLLTVALAAWVWRAAVPRAVRALAFAAVGAILLQSVVGGVTVLLGLPAAVSIAHSALAQVFFCTTVAMALVTSPGWRRAYRPEGAGRGAANDPDAARAQAVAADRTLHRLALATVVLVYLQVLIGATIRHVGASLAIPDYPLAYGRLLPSAASLASGPVAVAFAHRVGAVLATVAIMLTAARIWRRHPARPELVRPAAVMAALVLVQIALGGLIVLTARNSVVATVNVATGALLLATALVVALRTYRPLFGTDVATRVNEDGRARVPGLSHPRSASATSSVGMTFARIDRA
jgi:cytochrome c oxidase assembly protein subunit 15